MLPRQCDHRGHHATGAGSAPVPDDGVLATLRGAPAPVRALLAGVLILIMPRFLNFIVAIYLILVGLHGLGFLRMFHLG